MRRSIYDNSHNRNRTRIDARDSGNWATRLGVRGQHKDMRGNVIGGYGPDGQAFGTKQRQPGRMEPPMPNFTPAPAPAKAVQRPSYGPAPAPASTPNTQPKTAPRRAGIEPSMPKTNPLGAKLFPNRSAATPAAKLTQQIATNTPGARTSNINRLTGKPMGWRPTVEPADPPASAKPTPAWANKASPVAPSPTKMAPPADRMPTPTSINPTPPAPATVPAPITVAGTPIRTENYGKGAQSPASTPIAAKPAPAPQPAAETPAPTPAEITGSAMAMDRMRRPKNPLKAAETRASMRWQDRAM